MATTQLKPVSSGSYGNVALTAAGNCSKSTTGVAALASGSQHQLCHAINVFQNAGGAGTSASRAQKVAKAAGFLLQYA